MARSCSDHPMGTPWRKRPSRLARCDAHETPGGPWCTLKRWPQEGSALLLLIGPLLDRRTAARETRRFVLDTLLASALLVGGALALWASFGLVGGTPLSLPGNLLLGGASAAALAALWAACVAGLRVRLRKHRRAASDSLTSLLVVQLGAGALVALLLVAVERLFDSIVQSSSSIDLRHFSFHPWEGSRLALFGGLLAVHLAALWTATLIFVAAPSRWRLSSQAWPLRFLLLACWVLPTVLAVAFLAARDAPRAAARVAAFRRHVRRRGSRRATDAELVQTRDSRHANPVALRRVPDPGAAPLPVHQLSRGARHPAADHDAVRFRGAEPRDASPGAHARSEKRDRS